MASSLANREALQLKINDLTAKATIASEPGTAIEERVERLRAALTRLLYLQRGQAAQITLIIDYLNDLHKLHRPLYNGNTNNEVSDEIAKAMAVKAGNLMNEILVFKGMLPIGKGMSANGSMGATSGGSKTRRNKKRTRSNRKKSNRRR
jgi:hypothetical protein